MLDTRQPVSTYEQACWWLIGEWVDNPEFLNQTPLPPEGRLVCDIFWCTPETLLRDLRKKWVDMFRENPRVAFKRRGF